MSSVLEGVKVLELCEVFQGPLAGQILGDFGADVLKIERPGRGDSLRHSDTVANAHGKMGSYFGAVNRNKRSICLDLKSPDDQEHFRRLLQEADVLMHNYRPGVLERMGFSYAEVQKINPRIIYAGASGFGESGPLSGMAGQDFLIQSISGIAWKTTAAANAPTFINVPIADYTSGLLLAQGILLAILERQRSGLGQQVNVSLFNALIAMQSLEAATALNYDYETRWFERALNFTAQASDGWLTVIGFFRDNPLQLICKGLGIEDLSTTPGWTDKHGQAANKEAIAEVLRPHFLPLTVAQSVEQLQGAGVLAAPILDFNQVLAHPQVAANELIATVPVSGQEDMRFIGSPVKLSRTPATVRRGPPALNAHRTEIIEKSGD
ncbi:CaiB/BaiF CoA transferase family protein [Bordetella sp. 02P26C-1]|uniref:CaiB/BaiF CoA transferase family protein n=1 Tax=Bordetella sp. 02P26C-1 TaxID=2683195 RepID=UPI001355E125|nr:CoA transferase [Bordetella sp. 02P26C-1]MVW80132.1 CoA transferase [Bordetella sp. 02P26C-1]